MAHDSPRPAKFRCEQRKLKMPIIFAYDISGVLISQRVETGHNVNAIYYKGCIQRVLRPAIRRKRPELLPACLIILHDNAPHLSEGVTSLLTRYKWETLPHPSHCPDLSQCDFDFFPRNKTC